MIHIRLAPLDRELPSLTELRKRRQLLAQLAEWVEGEVWGDDVDVWLEVEERETALSQVQQLLADLSLEEALEEVVTVDLEAGV